MAHARSLLSGGVAHDPEGARYSHKLAVAGDQRQGDLTLFQQDQAGYWTQVLQ